MTAYLESRFNAYARAAEALTMESVERLSHFYASDCRFSDPFQTVQGRKAMAQVYRSMFNHLESPRFLTVRPLGQPQDTANEVVLGWDFEFALGKSKPRQSIAGCSRLIFNAQGEIQEHVDYWDASLLMQGLPVVGGVIAWIRRKIAGSH